MSIVITTPTGNIGRALTQSLLDAGQTPILIARDPAKVAEFVERGAKVVQGSHSDADLLTAATRGAEALFVLTPPDFTTTDVRASYRPYAEAAKVAIEANQIPYVVHLSSVGADLESGNGPVAGLHANEQILNTVDTNLVHLRPAYFMENTLGQVGGILAANSLFTTFPPNTRLPMIATRDIAAAAARLLIERDWTGRRTVELQGASEVSYEEVAAVLSEVLQRKITHVTVPEEAQLEALISMGFSRVAAEGIGELNESISKGLVKFHQARSEANTTATAYPLFAQTVFKAVFEAAAGA